ncbi:MAG: BamA/TamA family outer membrane protein [Alphaproteobacteria bacterium]|nr:BamA/TamA family outer membrane protein [Alphaproteobacteria bacterium]
MFTRLRIGAALAAGALAAGAASAQTAQTAATPGPADNPRVLCGQPIPEPRALPPPGSGPVVYQIALCFEAQGNTSLIDYQTYLYYIQLKASRPSEGVWVNWDESAQQTVHDDFQRLWNTKFLDNLWIDSKDYVFANGVIGKLITYNMEERQRVKIVDYVGSKKIETAKIDERLRAADALIRLDTFIDPALVRKVEGILREMLKEKGFQFAQVTHAIREMPGGPKLVHLTFNLDEGPVVKLRRIDFVGNEQVGDATLKRQMKEHKERSGLTDVAHLFGWFMSLLGGKNTYQEAKFDEDAGRVATYYRDHGYIRAVVGTPEIRVLEDSDDRKTRWVELRIPVTEGERYRIGTVEIAGNKVVGSDVLRPLFKLTPGNYYSEEKVRKGLEKAQEIYGAGGYFEFTGYPDLKPRDEPAREDALTPDALKPAPEAAGPPVVDVTLQMQEGEQYFVNRITFAGNTTTRDNVIRRELRLLENGVFNTEALKDSIRRINQLGYFKPLEGGKDVNVEKAPNTTNRVDVNLKVEEQNRNQLTFGAGVSEFEGFFGQLQFQTANFLGRGESLTLSLQAGSRAQNYSIGFTEPFLMDRNITGGLNVFRTDIRYIGQFTQRSTGVVGTLGFPLGRGFTRMFANYSYQQVRVTEISDLYQDPVVLQNNPYLADSLLIGQNGVRIISKITPSLVHNTVDNPIFPTTGKRFTASLDLAALGGNTHFYKPMLEAVQYWRQNARMSFGWRAQYEYIHAMGGTTQLPIFEKLFLGGEYSVRGFDMRMIGPQTENGVVLGGNKSLLFNLEELITIAGPVRLVLFYDAGQVQPGPELVRPPVFVPDGGETATIIKPGSSFQWRDFKTSTGAEIRFFMPVLNVPFRLIFAYNPQRDGVRNNQYLPQKAFQFRFAVGSTF